MRLARTIGLGAMVALLDLAAARAGDDVEARLVVYAGGTFTVRGGCGRGGLARRPSGGRDLGDALPDGPVAPRDVSDALPDGLRRAARRVRRRPATYRGPKGPTRPHRRGRARPRASRASPDHVAPVHAADDRRARRGRTSHVHERIGPRGRAGDRDRGRGRGDARTVRGRVLRASGGVSRRRPGAPAMARPPRVRGVGTGRIVGLARRSREDPHGAGTPARRGARPAREVERLVVRDRRPSAALRGPPPARRRGPAAHDRPGARPRRPRAAGPDRMPAPVPGRQRCEAALVGARASSRGPP